MRIPPLSDLIDTVLKWTGRDGESEPATADADAALDRRSVLKIAGLSSLGIGSYVRIRSEERERSAVTYGYGGVPLVAKRETGTGGVEGVTRMIGERTAAGVADSSSGRNAHARRLPGRVQVANFDNGSVEIASHDADTATEFGTRRPDSGVIADGEWLEYDVRIPAGTYDVSVRVASESAGNELRFTLDGSELGTVVVPATDGLQHWVTATLYDVDISTGGHYTLRLESLGGEYGLDWFEFANRRERTTLTPESTATLMSTPEPTRRWDPTPTSTPTPTATPTPTPTPESTATPTPEPTATPTPESTATPTPTPESTATPTPEPTATPTPEPTATPTPEPTATPTPTPTPEPTRRWEPTSTPTPTPTPTPTSTPTPTPTPEPPGTPTLTPASERYGEVGYGEMGYGG